MVDKMQMLLIRWILDPIYSIKKRIPEKVWSAVTTLSLLGMILIQFVYHSVSVSRYLLVFAPFCLFLGLIILAGLSENMKPVAFSKPLMISWGGVTLFMLITGLAVDHSVLADTILWLVAFPVLFIVWGNYDFKRLMRSITNAVYLSFAICMVFSIIDHPVGSTRYYAIFSSVNALSMYATAVFVVAVADLFSQKKFGVRVVILDLVMGMCVALAVYSTSRAGQVAIAVSGIGSAVIFLASRREKLWKAVLCYILPAVLAIWIMIPNGVYLINWGHEAVEQVQSVWQTEEEQEAEKKADKDPEDAWTSLQKINKKRRNQGSNEGLDAFSTGRVALWKIYLKEVGLMGNPSDKVLYDDNGNEVLKSAHNTLIQMAYEFGILAAVCYLVFNITSGVKALRYGYQKRGLDGSLFPLAIALAYGAYYLIEKVMYPVTMVLMLQYLLSQVPLFIQEKE